VLHYEEWGSGDPVIALHPLALESSAFAGVAGALSARGFRTLAVDLPGFGRSPAPDAPLTPSRLAEPVIELARSLERPPLLLGMSLGGRVAMEAALASPGSFSGAALVAPFMPWRRVWQLPLGLVRWLDPDWAEKVPLELAWPVLKRVAEALERIPDLEHDWLARASVRVVYYSSCPATRKSFFSALREMALDPRSGPESLWERLAGIRVPVTFLWAGRDALIPRSHTRDVGKVLPRADQIEVPCSGHFVSGAHFRCMREGIVRAVVRTRDAASAGGVAGPKTGSRTLAPCLADARELDADELEADSVPAAAEAASGRGGSE